MGVFDEIYNSNTWGFGSGHGSLPSVTRGYRNYLETFIRENNIRSITDYGCGDWQFSKLIDWGDAKYTGVDIVSSVVERNNQLYGKNNVRFMTIKPDAIHKIPKADLLIVKDVLQHLSDDMVHDFLHNVVPKFKHALITNCIWPLDEVNKPIKDGEFRPLDIRKKPFEHSATSVYTFTGPKSIAWKQRKAFPSWKKLVLYVNN
ncbi:MAG TPA: class I SAM-dependent methyltransferase [Candidatus Saccharimonadales bacterium]|nr:class I SAM-dependent methyltransferase [Candidatus Saccharimonadales bacterium]